MSSNPVSTPLPHRTVSNIRAGALATAPSSGSAQTPVRPAHSAYGATSSSSSRGDDDPVVIELGSRKLRVGFAGEAAPKRIATLSPEQQRRTGDFRVWDPDYSSQWRERASGKPWGADHEFWQLDLRGQDPGFVGDKLERELRDAFFKYMILDSRPRRCTLVLSPTLPLPLVSAALDTMFHRFQAPTISLLSSPVMATFAAGTRSALVIDLGWHETTVTAVYEYREVRNWRTIRAGKFLVEETYDFLLRAIQGQSAAPPTEQTQDRLALSFEECEEVATRMLWCKKAARQSQKQMAEDGLPTVLEHEEVDEIPPTEDHSPMHITLNSCQPPKTVEIPFSQLAEPCESTFFGTQTSASCFDDHELPVHVLVYRALLKLPLDVRAICMSRIMFTGGCSQIAGLKGRIFDEVCMLMEERGWDPVTGKGVEQYKTNAKLSREGDRQASRPIISIVIQPATENGNGEPIEPITNAADAPQEVDEVEIAIKKEQNNKPTAHGVLRVIDTLGSWCGASLATQMKIAALATIDREVWMQQGVNGASRPSEVDSKPAQRQSMGHNGLMRGQGAQPNNWTLGSWGTLF